MRIFSPFFTAMLFGALCCMSGCDGGGGGGLPDVPDCAITVTTPSSIEAFVSGDDVNIRWDETGTPDFVRIELLHDGMTVSVLAESTANDGFYPWFASGEWGGSGSGYAVRVTALGEAVCGGTSEPFTIFDTTGCSFAFTIEDSLLMAGENYDLTWESHSSTGTVDIGLYRWTGWIGDVAVNAVDSGVFVWEADSFHHGTDDHFWFEIRDHTLSTCMARSHDLNIFDTDICGIGVLSPAGDVVWHDDEIRNIEFTQIRGSGMVDIILKAGQTFVGTITTNYDMDAGPYSWQVHRYSFVGPAEYFRIEVIDAEDSYCRGESDLFTILP